MGPELITAIVGPIVGGVVSLYLWQNKKNYEFINGNFSNLNTSVNVIERKIDDIRVDVAKNYVTNDELVAHIQGEEQWHKIMHDEVSGIRKELSDVRNKLENNE